MTRHLSSSPSAGHDSNIVVNAHGLTAAGLAIVAVTYGLARYSFGLFLPEIRLEFGLSPEMIGLIAGSSYLGYLVTTFVGSWLSTVVEPRLPILLGGVAATSGMAIIAVARDPWILALGVFVAGTSPGLAYPPYSDVIVRHTEPGRQNSIYAWINSGTGFGVALAGPLALYAGKDWRLAWMTFAVLALAITFWNMLTVPRRGTGTGKTAAVVSVRLLFQRCARPLFTAALLFGVVTAVYWTYAVDLLLALTGNPRDAILFWIVLGISGVTGCFAGGLVDRWGLRNTYRTLTIAVGTAVGALPLLIGTRIGIYLSAASFGIGFIVVTALFGIWSMRIFRETPSIGFGFTFFLISLGQGIGPVISGFLIPVIGLSALFVVAGLLCCWLAVLRSSD